MSPFGFLDKERIIANRVSIDGSFHSAGRSSPSEDEDGHHGVVETLANAAKLFG